MNALRSPERIGSAGPQPRTAQPTARVARARAPFGHPVRKVAAPTTAPFASGPVEPLTGAGTPEPTLSCSGLGSVEPPLAGASIWTSRASSPRCFTTAREPSAPECPGGTPETTGSTLVPFDAGPATPARSRRPERRVCSCGTAPGGRSAPHGARTSRVPAGRVAPQRRPELRAFVAGPAVAAGDRPRAGAPGVPGALGLPPRPNSDPELRRISAACPLPTAHVPGVAGTGYRPAPLRGLGNALGSMVHEARRSPAAASEVTLATRCDRLAEADRRDGDGAASPCAPPHKRNRAAGSRIMVVFVERSGDRRRSHRALGRSSQFDTSPNERRGRRLERGGDSTIAGLVLDAPIAAHPFAWTPAGRAVGHPEAGGPSEAPARAAGRSRPSALGSFGSAAQRARALPSGRRPHARFPCSGRGAPTASLARRRYPCFPAEAGRARPLLGARIRSARHARRLRGAVAAPVPAAATAVARSRGRA